MANVMAPYRTTSIPDLRVDWGRRDGPACCVASIRGASGHQVGRPKGENPAWGVRGFLMGEAVMGSAASKVGLHRERKVQKELNISPSGQSLTTGRCKSSLLW